METLNKIKLAVVGIAGAITAVFGWMGWLVIGFAACMLLDWITGSVAGSKKDGWSSATARAGLWHKGGMLVVAIKLPFEYSVLVCPLVLCWYIVTELGSICENAAALGAPLPGFLKKILAVVKNSTEDVGESLTGGKTE